MSILTAVDGETVPSRSVEVGYELARQFDEDLDVLHVMRQEVFDQIKEATTEERALPAFPSGVSYDASERTGGSTSRFTIDQAQDRAAGLARDVVEGTLEDWHAVNFVGRVGEPATEILEEASRREARYLVIGGRKRSPVGKALFGSITQSVLLNANLPVMSVMHQG